MYDEQRFTYQQIHSRAAKLAAVFKHKYGIQKGYSLDFGCTFVPLTSAGQGIELVSALEIAQISWSPSGHVVSVM